MTPAGSSCQRESRGSGHLFIEVHCHSGEESGQALKEEGEDAIPAQGHEAHTQTLKQRLCGQ